MNGVLRIKSRIKTRMILVIYISTLDTTYTIPVRIAKLEKY